jgi:hypothetical protein
MHTLTMKVRVIFDINLGVYFFLTKSNLVPPKLVKVFV